MLQINVGSRLCFCSTARLGLEWLCCLSHLHSAFCAGGGERGLLRKPGLCSWGLCWGSTGSTGAGEVNSREKALLGFGVKSHPWKDQLPALQPRQVLLCILMKAEHRRAAKYILQGTCPRWHLGELHLGACPKAVGTPGQGQGVRVMLGG